MTKWPAPGTLDAMRCYAGLPRRPDVRTFFHPADDDGAEVRLDVAFEKFATDFFPATGPRPTVRMLQRFYHGSRLPRAPAARSFLARHCPYSRGRCCGHEVTGGVHLRITSDLAPT